MRNLENESTDCAEKKLDLIRDILQLDCEVINDYSTLSPLVNLKLSAEQTGCMNEGANRILKETLEDFKIETGSFKNLPIKYKYIHFIFVDKTSLVRFPTIQPGSHKHNLYYIIVVCDHEDLNVFDFITYDAYLVDSAGMAKTIELPKEIYAEMRKEFLGGVGKAIRENSTYNAITEYISFSNVMFETFRNDLSGNFKEVNVRLIAIHKNCDINSQNVAVSRVLNDNKKQSRLSLAFQKEDQGFYDIGNMQP
ncbi:hypothetical protein AAEU33_02670 [Chryseobacterium sp. Chry.R1]|uniref:hypothetical protein n=1 Tax=Chryseobacterium sp. Chry.R1 TaxID=3139392 RepID=UPI0031FA406E